MTIEKRDERHEEAISGADALKRHPTPPPMRVVTQGWWVLRERAATLEQLQREDRERFNAE